MSKGTFNIIFIEIGGKNHLSLLNRKEAAAAFRLARVKHPRARIGFTLGGYDDDPREIYDIPEARDYIRQWAHDAGLSRWQDAIKVPWEESLDNLGVLQLCGTFTDDSPIKVNTPMGLRR
jgi:hypothetical protein